MKLFFDKSFVANLQTRTDLNHPVVENFINTIFKKLRGVQVFSSITSDLELKSLIQNNRYYNWLSEINSIESFEFSPSFIKDNIAGSTESIVYFSDQQTDLNILSSLEILLISNDTLIDKWQPFYYSYENEMFVIDNNTKVDNIFKDWKQLSNLSHPKKSVLIFDLYILINKSNQRVEDNLIPCILNVLGDFVKNKPHIYLFTNELEKKGKENNWELKELMKIHDLIVEKVEKIKGLSLFKYDKTKFKGAEEHNRFIITDYFFISTGAGFNIYKTNQQVNKKDQIRFDHLFRNNTRNAVNNTVNGLKEYLQQINVIDKKVVGPGKFVDDYFKYPDSSFEFNI